MLFFIREISSLGSNTDNRRLRYFDPESDQKLRNRVVCGGEDFSIRDLTGTHFDYP
jgi:hypothetical protein